MSEQNKHLNTKPTEEVLSIEPPKRSWWRYVVGVLVMVIAVLGGYITWYQYFSSEAKYRGEVEESALALPAKLETYQKAMEADVYGGKTPEETLQLFIDALKEGDVELASKYFILGDNLQRDSKWFDALRRTKESEKLGELIVSLEKAEPDLESRAYENDFKFKTSDGYGYINLEFNKHSGVWKIESL